MSHSTINNIIRTRNHSNSNNNTPTISGSNDEQIQETTTEQDITTTEIGHRIAARTTIIISNHGEDHHVETHIIKMDPTIKLANDNTTTAVIRAMDTLNNEPDLIQVTEAIVETGVNFAAAIDRTVPLKTKTNRRVLFPSFKPAP